VRGPCHEGDPVCSPGGGEAETMTSTGIWILVAILKVHEVMGGHVTEYIGVYATPAACERDRAKMQAVDDDNVWRCIHEDPKS